MSNPGIWILTDNTSLDDGSKEAFDTGASYDPSPPTGKRVRISADQLQAQLEEFLGVVEQAFDQAEKKQTQSR